MVNNTIIRDVNPSVGNGPPRDGQTNEALQNMKELAVIVELIYDADCPNVPDTRSQLIKAFAQMGISACWREWERGAPETPKYARAYGSPTILVDGKDIAGVVPDADTRACRVYGDGRGKLGGIPSVAAICAALRDSAPGKKTTRTG